MKVTVENNHGEIVAIWPMYATDRLAIVRIQTKDKRPEPLAYSSKRIILPPTVDKDHPCTVDFEDLPWQCVTVHCETGRYYMDVTIRDWELEEELMAEPPEPLYEAP